jgi:aryl-alcohol dehydrogenase-like predicted oxidoreductase
VVQVALAWVLSRGDDIVPLIGARRRDRLSEPVGALNVHFTKDELAQIERAVPLGAAAGECYQESEMANLDSERGALARRPV